jgi:hypothetical protein
MTKELFTKDARPFVKSAADEEQVSTARRKERFDRKSELADVRSILGTAEGRRFVWRYLGLCRVFESSWSPSAAIHFNEGQRDIGLRLLDDVTEANDESLIQMMREAKERERRSAPEGE